MTQQPGQRVFPLSAGQRRLWLVEEMGHSPGAYNVSLRFDLRGPLDVAALARGLRWVASRHEVLRSRFRLVDGEPAQLVTDELPELAQVDVQDEPPDARQRLIERHITETAQRPFNLADEPPLRARLLRNSDEPDHAILILSLHHLVCDAWSQKLVVDDLSRGYAAALRGADPDVPPLPLQFGEHVLRELGTVDSDAQARSLDHWRHALRALAPLELDPRRPGSHAPPRARHAGRALEPALAKQALAVARRERVTPFVLYFAAYQALLLANSVADEGTVGVALAERQAPHTAPMVGFLVNTLPIVVRRRDPSTFRHLLGAVRTAVLEAFQHSIVPFDRIVEAVRPVRDRERNPLFSMMFALDGEELAPPTFPGVASTVRAIPTRLAKVDLVLTIRNKGAETLAEWEYNGARFSSAVIEQLDDQYHRILQAALTDPDLPLASSPPSRVHAASRPAPEAVAHADVVTWLDRRLAEPERIAVFDGEQRLSFGELAGRASRLAGVLVDLGIGPESLVGVCMERSLEWVVSLLAILRSGAAYVPLDPSYPEDRLRSIARSAGLRALVTHRGLGARFDLDVPALDLDRPLPAGAGSLPPPPHPDGLAYVIHTSGSTGTPNPVGITHRGLSNLVHWAQSFFSLGPDDRCSLLASVGFDASVLELWPALCAGSAVDVMDDRTLRDPGLLRAWFCGRRITFSYLPTVLAELALQWDWTGAALRILWTGGDTLHRRPPAVLPFTLVNLYGPTECTVCVTGTAVGSAGHGAPDLGLPIAGIQSFVLDESLRPAAQGELFVAGVALARGYLSRPALTAERFIPDPFGPPGSRLYRTGDLVRRSQDGRLHFLGRADSQVKLRGYRIELGEIEAALSRHPAVRSAAVALHDGQIVAYVVPAVAVADGGQVLRADLERQLPGYMVPSQLLGLDALPLTPHGKLDRSALRAPPARDSLGADDLPRTHTERVLASIWQETLGLPVVGRRDDFFELGGHSLAAMRVLFEIGSRLNRAAALRDVLVARTIATLAARLDALPTRADATAAHEEDPELPPLSSAQRRLWFVHRLQPRSDAYNVSLAFRIRGALEFDALDRALVAVITRHDALRMRVAELDGEPRIRFAAPPKTCLRVDDLDRESGRDQAIQSWIVAEATWPFELARDELFRARLLQLADDDYVLVLTGHHICIDGGSLRVIFEELRQIYHALRDGVAVPVAAQAVSYRRWIEHERTALDGAREHALAERWRTRLARCDETARLIRDRQPDAGRPHRAATERIVLPRSAVDDVQRLAAAHGTTRFVVYLAALQTLLAQLGGCADTVVGFPVDGRSAPEFERLVGMLVNLVPARTRVTRELRFAELVDQVRDGVVDALADSALPFDRIVEAVAIDRHPDRHPLFDVILVHDSAPAMLMLDDLSIAPAPISSQTAKLDLIVSISDGAGDGELVGEYDADVLARPAIVRVLERYRAVLGAASRSPETRIADLTVLLPEERHFVQARFDETARAYPKDKCVHELVSEQAASLGDRVAVVHDGRQLTYRRLDELADRLAGSLIAAGVRLDTCVGVCLERSIEQIVTLLAILKAGGAYLPLDPSYPAERLRAIALEARPSLVVTQQSLRPVFLASTVELLCVDQEWPAPATAAPAVRVHPDNLAYVMSTSGSTGHPKAVAVPHRAVVRLVRNAGYATLDPDQVVLHLAPLAFDASTFEIWGALANGARLVLYPHPLPDPERLRPLIRDQRVTTMWLTAGIFHQLVDDAIEILRPLSELLAGGDVLSPPHVATALRELPGCTVINGYGPTESTTFACCHRVVAQDEHAAVPIGKPIGSTAAYVLDPSLSLVGVGVVGELYIGGDGLARGYLHRPALTAERFIPNPFGPAGSRLYRTGDLARLSCDGNLEFLGRQDNQVKIRGHRIELGEVDAALRRQPGVRDALVVVRGEAAHDKRLVAYVVPPSAADGLRDALARQLPGFLIPSEIIGLDGFPLTPNGKVDRRALPTFDPRRAGAPAPASELEQSLAEIWCEILGVPAVGRDDNFFDLGGTSLQLLRVHAAVQRRLGREIGVIELLRASSISALAARLAMPAEEAAARAAVPTASARQSTPSRLSARREVLTSARRTS